MRKACLLFFLAIPSLGVTSAQVKRTSIPLGDAVANALAKSNLTGEKARPFHIRINVSEPENPKSSYQGTIEEWWVSPDQYRREVTDVNDMHQTIVVTNGIKTEKDEGDYFPLWLRNFVTALFDPVPWATQYSTASTIDQATMPNGDKSDACVRSDSQIGKGVDAATAYTNVCFDGNGRLQFVGSPRYSVGFGDYHVFGDKQIPFKLGQIPESGTRLEGAVALLDAISDDPRASELYTPLRTNDSRFRSLVMPPQEMEGLRASTESVVWPSVRSGNTRGHLAIYISVDNQGRVQEAWPLSSDNGGIDDSVRDQVRKWKFKLPLGQDGKPLQMDGPLTFVFDTKLENAIPILTSPDDIALQIGTCPYNPTLSRGLLPPGIHMKIDISVNEKGEEVGAAFPPVSMQVIEATHMNSRSCIFKPYLVNGKPVFYHLTLSFSSR